MSDSMYVFGMLVSFSQYYACEATILLGLQECVHSHLELLHHLLQFTQQLPALGLGLRQ